MHLLMFFVISVVAEDFQMSFILITAKIFKVADKDLTHFLDNFEQNQMTQFCSMMKIWAAIGKDL